MENKTLQLLLVEDDIALGQTISELLTMNNYQVKWCKNGLEAFRFLEDNTPDVIVCDLMMPIMSGEELFLKIRNFRKFDMVPFMIITADMTFERKIKQLENGVNEFINKPFKIQELLLKIKNIIQYKESILKLNQDPLSKVPVKFRRNDFIENLNSVLIKNLKTNISIEKLASEVHVSKSTLDKKIRSLKKVNISTYIREFKLNYAIKMMEAGQTSVDVLATESGFNSLSYFSICFKKYTGASPKDYIKKLKVNS
jgi:DNA-binding response OmpR family regulator